MANTPGDAKIPGTRIRAIIQSVNIAWTTNKLYASHLPSGLRVTVGSERAINPVAACSFHYNQDTSPLCGAAARPGVATSCGLQSDLAARPRTGVHDRVDQAPGQLLHLPEGGDVHPLREVVGHGRVARHAGHPDAGAGDALPPQHVPVGRAALVGPGRA